RYPPVGVTNNKLPRLPSFPPAWERKPGTPRVPPGVFSAHDAERRRRAFPRRAWEREGLTDGRPTTGFGPPACTQPFRGDLGPRPRGRPAGSEAVPPRPAAAAVRVLAGGPGLPRADLRVPQAALRRPVRDRVRVGPVRREPPVLPRRPGRRPLP